MTEELNNSEEQATGSDKNWKEMRENSKLMKVESQNLKLKKDNKFFNKQG